jgi:DNA-binding response OmpR family regulator
MAPHPATILLAHANLEPAEELAELLRADGHDPLVSTTPDEACDLLATKAPDLAIVWLELPDALGGYAVIRTVRGSDPHDGGIDPFTPLIAIDPRACEFNCLRTFEHGCDDYLAGDCSSLELRARLAALLRRARGRLDEAQIEIGDLLLDSCAHEVRVGGTPVELSPKEFALLRELACQPNRVFTKAELLRSVWGYRSLGQTRTLDTHAGRLRRKLARAGATPSVGTVWGVGYRLSHDPAPIAA